MSSTTPSTKPASEDGRDQRPRLAIVLGLLAAGLAVAAIAVLTRRAAETGPVVASAPGAEAPAVAPQRAGGGMSSNETKSELERARDLRRALGVEQPGEPPKKRPASGGDGD